MEKRGKETAYETKERKEKDREENDKKEGKVE